MVQHGPVALPLYLPIWVWAMCVCPLLMALEFTAKCCSRVSASDRLLVRHFYDVIFKDDNIFQNILSFENFWNRWYENDIFMHTKKYLNFELKYMIYIKCYFHPVKHSTMVAICFTVWKGYHLTLIMYLKIELFLYA